MYFLTLVGRYFSFSSVCHRKPVTQDSLLYKNLFAGEAATGEATGEATSEAATLFFL